jgi:hypothetical protein
MKPAESRLFYSCSADKYVADEYIVPTHLIMYIYDGEFIMENNTTMICLRKGFLFYNAWCNYER